jgi:hypothetical protein
VRVSRRLIGSLALWGLGMVAVPLMVWHPPAVMADVGDARRVCAQSHTWREPWTGAEAFLWSATLCNSTARQMLRDMTWGGVEQGTVGTIMVEALGWAPIGKPINWIGAANGLMAADLAHCLEGYDGPVRITGYAWSGGQRSYLLEAEGEEYANQWSSVFWGCEPVTQ